MAVWLGLAGAGLAAPDTSLRPWPRPEGSGLVLPLTVDIAAAVVAPRLPPRTTLPLSFAAAPAPASTQAALYFTGLAAARLRGLQPAALTVPRPPPRPDDLSGRIRAGSFRLFKRKPNYSIEGSVCGIPAIRGTAVAPISGSLSGCGIANPVKVSAVAGVSLSVPALMDCTTAKALHNWVRDKAVPAVGNTGGGLLGLKVAAHYSCRSRNNRPGAKISEHGKGRAIDLSGFFLKEGAISVLSDWGRGRKGRILSKLRKSACGPFGTVLGPGSDGYHRDHFHFDTARHRSGSYCR